VPLEVERQLDVVVLDVTLHVVVAVFAVRVEWRLGGYHLLQDSVYFDALLQVLLQLLLVILVGLYHRQGPLEHVVYHSRLLVLPTDVAHFLRAAIPGEVLLGGDSVEPLTFLLHRLQRFLLLR